MEEQRNERILEQYSVCIHRDWWMARLFSWRIDETDLDEELNIPTVTKTYTKEEPVTIDLGKVLSATQDLLWEEEFDASKEEALSYSHPCAEIINTLNLRQKKCDGYY